MALAVRPPPNATAETLLHEGSDVCIPWRLPDPRHHRLSRADLRCGDRSVGGRLTRVTSARTGSVAVVGIVGAHLGRAAADGVAYLVLIAEV